jgi:solute carrier family 50 protein (sugar transporter)
MNVINGRRTALNANTPITLTICSLLTYNFSCISDRGSAAVTVLGVYYVAPLSTVATVLKNRDSSSLYWPLSLMNVINGCLWFAYGLAILDYFIFVPK